MTRDTTGWTSFIYNWKIFFVLNRFVCKIIIYQNNAVPKNGVGVQKMAWETLSMSRKMFFNHIWTHIFVLHDFLNELYYLFEFITPLLDRWWLMIFWNKNIWIDQRSFVFKGISFEYQGSLIWKWRENISLKWEMRSHVVHLNMSRLNTMISQFLF